MNTTAAGATALIPVLDAIPGPFFLLAALLLLTFVLHLLFMNAVVGVSLITFGARMRRKKKKKGVETPEAFSLGSGYIPDLLLPKGIALVVNFGIPPFLFMQCLYGQYIYSSSVLMAVWWLSVMGLVMLAYYGLYFNMVRRNLPPASRNLALGIAVALLLCTAFVFVNNMTLLEKPASWTIYATHAGGAFLNLNDPQTLPRYLHVLLSCIAVGGVCLALPEELALRRLARQNADPEASRAHIERRSAAMRWFQHATLAQLPVGFWYFMSLGEAQRVLFLGGDRLLSLMFGLAIMLAIMAMDTAWRDKAFSTAALLVPIVALMAAVRMLVRISAMEAWYAPDFRELDLGPFLLFVIALIASLAGIVWLVRLYLKNTSVPDDVPDKSVPDDEKGVPFWQLRREEALLVIELTSRRDEEEEENGTSGNKGAGE